LLDHVIIFNETSLRRTLSGYLSYYHRSRTHLALDKDAPETRPVQPSDSGNVVAIPEVGGLHHRYQRRAAWHRMNRLELAGCPNELEAHGPGRAAMAENLVHLPMAIAVTL
jgi:hypothetical protein